MKVLIIGLGSMGKRRIRNLHALGVRDIYGYDERIANAREAAKHYGITLLPSFRAMAHQHFDLAIISTPPGAHLPFALSCAKRRVPFFVELNLITREARAINRIAKKYKVRWFASNTELFDADIAAVRKYAPRGHFLFRLGQNIHDWHPWQKAGEHFIFKPATNGMREMLRIELPWILELFGPARILSVHAARIETKRYGVDDLLSVEIGFASGARGTIVLDLLTPDVIKYFDVIARGRRVTWHERVNRLTVYTRGEKKTILLRKKKIRAHYAFTEDAHCAEIRHVLRVLSGKEKNILTFEKELNVLRLIDTVERKRRYD